jgi:hypothetical protein
MIGWLNDVMRFLSQERPYDPDEDAWHSQWNVVVLEKRGVDDGPLIRGMRDVG